MSRRLVLAGVLAVFVSACAPPPEPPAELEGVSIHYTDVGAGSRALVFVHGWASDSTAWSEQIPALADVGRLIAIDLPGHGHSERPEIEYTMEYWARSIDAVMQHTGVEQAVLVGHSNGVPLVRQFYRQYPDKTLAVVAIDGALVQVMAPEALQGFVQKLSGDGWRELVVGMTRGTLQHGDLTGEQKRSVEAAAASTPQHVAVGGLRAIMDPAVLRPDPIAVPVLVVNAVQPTWNEEYVARVRQLAPDLEYTDLEGVNHYLMLDDPERFNALLRAFLTEHSLL